MHYGIYSIKNYYYSIINTIIILRLKLYTHGSSTQSRRKLRVQLLAPNQSEHYGLWLYNLFMSLLSTHDLNESLYPNHLTRHLFHCCSIFFFYPKYVLLRLLKFLFIKRTLNFLSVIIGYFICHWNGQLNFRNCKKPLPSLFECTLYQMFSFSYYSIMITNRKFWCQAQTTKFWI